MQWRIVHIGRTLCVCVCVEFSAFRCSLLHIVSLLMSEKRIDAVSLSFLWVPLSLSSSPPLSPSPLSLRCEWGEARWVAMSEGMQQWGRWSLISQWKVYFSLVNRHGCISLSLTPPAQSPSFPLHFYSSFLSLPPPFSLSLSLLPIWSCTEDRLRVLFFFDWVFLPCGDTEGPILLLCPR